MAQFVIAEEDPGAPDVRRLLQAHLAFAAQHSPPEDMHAMDSERLAAEQVAVFSVREQGRLLGIGAIKQLDEAHAELKSMHTLEEARGRGVAAAMLAHLIAAARDRGCERVSLETGSMNPFAPARALYAGAGFTECPPFGDYAPSGYSVWMTLELTPDQKQT